MDVGLTYVSGAGLALGFEQANHGQRKLAGVARVGQGIEQPVRQGHELGPLAHGQALDIASGHPNRVPVGRAERQ